jgi:hypothetical protein
MAANAADLLQNAEGLALRVRAVEAADNPLVDAVLALETRVGAIQRMRSEPTH